MEMIDIRGLEFRYGSALSDSQFRLRIPELRIQRREKVAVIGPSGSGKTTLIYLVAGILVPRLGSIVVNGQSITALSEKQRRRRRLEEVGFVFQEFELLEYLTAKENITLPNDLSETLVFNSETQARFDQIVSDCGLAELLHRYPDQLSQGEKQRVALCRALLNDPPLFIADEPTGNLDSKTTTQIMELLVDLVTRNDQTLLMVTHDPSLLPYFDRVIDFSDFLEEDP